MTRNISLDGIKVALAILIVSYHTSINFFSGQSVFKYLSAGYLAVDGFFIISGYLLAASIERRAKSSRGLDFLCFMKDRFIRLFPEYFFVLIFTTIIGIVFHEKTHLDLVIPNIIFLANINGIGAIVRDPWFISSLFWVSLLFFACFVVFEKKLSLLLIGGLTFLSLSGLSSFGFGISVHSAPIIGIFSGGVLRTVFGLGCGILLYQIRYCIYNIKPKLRYMFDFISIVICFYYVGHERFGILGAFFSIPFSYIVLRLFDTTSLCSKIFSIRFFKLLSPFSYMLFLCHLIIIEHMNKYCRDFVLSFNPYISMTAIVMLSVILSVILFPLSKLFWKVLSNSIIIVKQ